MRTIRTKVYKFNELKTEAAKQKAINFCREINDFGFVWEDIKEDAKEIGLKLKALDDHRANKGEFMLSACEVAQNIFNNHGEVCETYKTAEAFMKDWQPVFNAYIETEENETELMDIEDSFLHDLLEDYRIMYNQNIEYSNSDAAIIEMIEVNEYEFTADGRRI